MASPEPGESRFGLAPLAFPALILLALGVWWFTRPTPEARKPDVPPVTMPLGERIYRGSCAGCHGDEGRGDGPVSARIVPTPTDFLKGPWKRGDSPDAIRKSIVEGVLPAMAPLRTLTDEELSALVEHVRKLATAK
jgi:mono/diheme cytochrome c family protein